MTTNMMRSPEGASLWEETPMGDATMRVTVHQKHLGVIVRLWVCRNDQALAFAGETVVAELEPTLEMLLDKVASAQGIFGEDTPFAIALENLYNTIQGKIQGVLVTIVPTEDGSLFVKANRLPTGPVSEVTFWTSPQSYDETRYLATMSYNGEERDLSPMRVAHNAIPSWRTLLAEVKTANKLFGGEDGEKGLVIALDAILTTVTERLALEDTILEALGNIGTEEFPHGPHMGEVLNAYGVYAIGTRDQIKTVLHRLEKTGRISRREYFQLAQETPA